MPEIDKIEQEHNAFIDEQLNQELGRLPNDIELSKAELIINPVTKTKTVLFNGKEVGENERK